MAPLLAAVELPLELPLAVLAAPHAAGSPHDPPTPHVVATPLGAAGPIIEAAAQSAAWAAAAPLPSATVALPPLVGNHPPKRPWRKEEDALLLRLARAAPPPLACALSRAVPTRSLPRSASPTYFCHTPIRLPSLAPCLDLLPGRALPVPRAGHTARPGLLVSHLGGAAGADRQAVPRALAQPPHPRCEEGEVHSGGGQGLPPLARSHAHARTRTHMHARARTYARTRTRTHADTLACTWERKDSNELGDAAGIAWPLARA